jgi:HK97 family phage major capsid protein
MYDFKHLKIDDREKLDPDQLEFFKTLDNGFDQFGKKYQEQINDIYTRIDGVNRRPGEQKADSRERELTRRWIVKYLKKEPLQDLNQELKFAPIHSTDPMEDRGAVLVPELLAQEINHYVIEGGIARREMRYMPISGPGNTRRIPVESGGVSVQWVDEAAAKPVTGLTLTQVNQTLQKLAAIVVLTEELIEDQSFDLVGYAARRIGEAIATEEDRVFFAGSIIAGDPFAGVINAAGITPVVMDVAEAVDEVTADTLLRMVYSLSKHARTGAKFYMHSDVLFRIQRLRIDVLAENDGLGGYLVSPATASAPASIWGYPIVTVDELPAANEVDPDDPFMIFANLQKTCVYGQKDPGLRIKLLTEATLTDSDGQTISLAQNDAVGVRVYKRTGYVPVLPEGIAVLVAGSAT